MPPHTPDNKTDHKKTVSCHQRALPSRRVQNISASTTKEMAMAAAKIGGCVSLGQGVPSFSTPDHIIGAVITALKENPGSGKYSLQTGMPELRNEICAYLKSEKHIHADPETQICVTVGGMEALLATVLTLVDTGDEVILFTPTYASYIEQIHLAQGIPVFVPMTSSWELDVEAFKKSISQKTRAVMICNPGNPTGNLFSKAEIIQICELALEFNFMVILDEAYDYIVYSQAPPLNPAGLDKYKDCVISVFSLSKKYALTGWRIGWVHAPEHWMKHIMKVHDATTICAPTPSQFAGLAALKGDQTCVQKMIHALCERRELCCNRLDRLTPFFSYVPPKGAFYVMAKYLFSEQNSLDMAMEMLHQAKVITIPGESFGPGGERHLRLSFGGDPDELNEAFDRIEAWLSNRKHLPL